MSPETSLERYREIAALIYRYRRAGLFRSLDLDDAALGDHSEPPAEPGRPEAFAEDLERLGPTFIKLGQVLSTRPDLVPPDYLSALERIQDDVEPRPFPAIREIVEAELGVRLNRAFPTFEEEPIAAASLAQVHRARLRDGRDVAVKVLRPGVRERIRADLAAFDKLATLVDRMTEAGRRYRFGDWVREFRRTVTAELDFRIEAENLERFRTNLEPYPRLRVPAPVWDLTGRHVLTMELVRGVNVARLPDVVRTEVDLRELADQLVEAYLDQVFVHGLIHADPHPGNVLLTDEHELALIDLGMVAHVAPRTQDRLLKLLLAAVDGRGEDVARHYVELGVPLEAHDPDRLVHTVSQLVARYRSYERSDPASEGRLVLELVRAGADAGLKPPAELSLLGKTLLNLEAVCDALVPGYGARKVVEHHLHDVMRRRLKDSVHPASLAGELLEMKELTRELPRRLSGILELLSDNRLQVRIAGLDESYLMRNLQKIANRIASGLVIAALIVGAAMLMRIETQATLFGYPALAILLFLVALALGGSLVFGAMLQDRRHAGPERRSR